MFDELKLAINFECLCFWLCLISILLWVDHANVKKCSEAKRWKNESPWLIIMRNSLHGLGFVLFFWIMFVCLFVWDCSLELKKKLCVFLTSAFYTLVGGVFHLIEWGYFFIKNYKSLAQIKLLCFCVCSFPVFLLCSFIACCMCVSIFIYKCNNKNSICKMNADKLL